MAEREMTMDGTETGGATHHTASLISLELYLKMRDQLTHMADLQSEQYS